MKFIGIIPARYASTRFPGKPLAMLGGKTVIQRVYEQVAEALNVQCSTFNVQRSTSNVQCSTSNVQRPPVWVATDDERIMEAVRQFGGRAVMTRSDHRSGTDRIEEAAEIINTDADVIINVQGDEPFIQCSQLQTVIRLFDDPMTQIATLGKPFETMEAVANPNSPKIVCDVNGYAMYFSRSVIPFIRDAHPTPSTSEKQQTAGPHPDKEAGDKLPFPYLKHIGLYAYRREVLAEITKLPQSPLELAESLEQLRWLQNGFRIKVGITDVETVGIDTPEDLQRAEAFLSSEE